MIFDITFYNYIYKFENEIKFNKCIKIINERLIKLFYYTKGKNFKYIQTHCIKFTDTLHKINDFDYELIN